MSDYQGGCACGAVRYSFSGYTDAGYCHCSACRRATGAPVSVWAQVQGFGVTNGAPSVYATRAFCGACGSPLYAVREPVEVYVASLDEPARIEPRIHRWIADQVPWLKLGDMLPFVDDGPLTDPASRQKIRLPVDPAIGRDSLVTLREITKENARGVLQADVQGAQRRFVASNAVSLAQALLEGDAWYRAIYAADTVVGFVMAAVLKEDELGLPTAGEPNLWRFMIDERYQGYGFGRRALELIVTELRSWGGANVWVGAVPGRGSPYEFYRRFGFLDTGVQDDGEIFLRLPRS